MKIRIREQAGTDAVRKFDYQMAVALDYLLSEMDNDAIILIETLEDFAIFRNHGSENETIDVFQQGKGKRERLTFARKGAFAPVGPCLNQYNGWSAEKRAEVIDALTEKGIKVRHP